MRGLLLALSLVGCAHQPADLSDLRGCWIDRRPDGSTVTMRWFPADDGFWRGDWLLYRPDTPPEPAAYTLSPAARLEGGGKALDVVVKADADTLKITDPAGTIFYAARRDGCD